MESLSFKAPIGVSPSATSKPIAIPSRNKKNKKKVNNIQDIISFTKSNLFTSPISSPVSSPVSSPKIKFQKISSYDEPKTVASSIVSLFKKNNLKEKNGNSKNKNNLKCNTIDRKKKTNESNTPVDNKFTEFSSFLTLRKSKTKSPELKNNSVATLCVSPTVDTNISQEIESSSLLTICTSPKAENLSNMSNDQLFKLLPKKIIRAIDNYTAFANTEISYKKGDFFFVVSENESYYFVTNPSTKTSGYVSKFSFEQVDNFANHNKSKSNLSPVAEKSDNKLNKNQNPLTDRIMTASVTEEIVSRNTQNTFPIEVTKIDGTVAVLYRSYNDVCQLHKSILECFPEDAGSITKERIIPFLPSHDAIFNHSKKSPRRIINSYLQKLTRLPNYIQFSEPFLKFFNVHKDDILSSIYVVSQLNFFNSEDEEDDDDMIKVKTIMENDDSEDELINIIRMSPKINLDELFDTLEDKLDTTLSNIYYQNENNEKVKIFGDKDLKLYFNSNSFSYVLWLN